MKMIQVNTFYSFACCLLLFAFFFGKKFTSQLVFSIYFFALLCCFLLQAFQEQSHCRRFLTYYFKSLFRDALLHWSEYQNLVGVQLVELHSALWYLLLMSSNKYLHFSRSAWLFGSILLVFSRFKRNVLFKNWEIERKIVKRNFLM